MSQTFFVARVHRRGSWTSLRRLTWINVIPWATLVMGIIIVVVGGRGRPGTVRLSFMRPLGGAIAIMSLIVILFL